MSWHCIIFALFGITDILNTDSEPYSMQRLSGSNNKNAAAMASWRKVLVLLSLNFIMVSNLYYDILKFVLLDVGYINAVIFFKLEMSEGKSSPLVVGSNRVEAIGTPNIAREDLENGTRATPSEATHATLAPAQPAHLAVGYGTSQNLTVPSQHETTAAPSYLGSRTDLPLTGPDVESFFSTLDARSVQPTINATQNSNSLINYEENLATLSNAHSGYSMANKAGQSQYYPSPTMDFYKSGGMFPASSTTPLLQHHYSVTANR